MTHKDDGGGIKVIRAKDFLKRYEGIKFGYILGNNGSERFAEDHVSPSRIRNLAGGKVVYIKDNNDSPPRAALALNKNNRPFWYFEAKSYNGAEIFFCTDGDGSVVPEGDEYLGRIHEFLEKKKYRKAKSGGRRGKRQG